jgi:hypothetical protein
LAERAAAPHTVLTHLIRRSIDEAEAEFAEDLRADRRAGSPWVAVCCCSP